MKRSHSVVCTNCEFWWSQIQDDVLLQFHNTIDDMEVQIDWHPAGQDPITAPADYVDEWRVNLWETAFFREFSVKGKDAIDKNNKPEQQPDFARAARRVLYRYMKHVLILPGVLNRTPIYFKNYLSTSHDHCMFTNGIVDKWKPVHFNYCGWYLDCPKTRCPESEIDIRDKLEPALKNTKQIKPKPAAELSPVGTPGSKGKKGRKRKEPEQVINLNSSGEEEAAPQAAPKAAVPKAAAGASTQGAMTRSKASPQPPQKSTPEQPQAGPSKTKKAKQDRVEKGVATTPKLAAVSKALSRMLLDLPIPQTASTGRTFLINDSFERIAHELKETGKTPDELQTISTFLSEVYIVAAFPTNFFVLRIIKF